MMGACGELTFYSSSSEKSADVKVIIYRCIIGFNYACKYFLLL